MTAFLIGSNLRYRKKNIKLDINKRRIKTPIKQIIIVPLLFGIIVDAPELPDSVENTESVKNKAKTTMEKNIPDERMSFNIVSKILFIVFRDMMVLSLIIYNFRKFTTFQ